MKDGIWLVEINEMVENGGTQLAKFNWKQCVEFFVLCQEELVNLDIFYSLLYIPPNRIVSMMKLVNINK